MKTAIIDDHILRDFLSNTLSDDALYELADYGLATTNLWYVRLCRSVSAARGGKITAALDEQQRNLLGAQLVELDDRVMIQPMQELAWSIASFCTHYRLSTLAAEALAAAHLQDASILVWAGDDGPNLRAACGDLDISYTSIP